jgi:hypothetical protein
VVARVRIPDEATIVGFGPGVVYLARHDGGDLRLTKVSVRLD